MKNPDTIVIYRTMQKRWMGKIFKWDGTCYSYTEEKHEFTTREDAVKFAEANDLRVFGPDYEGVN